MNIEINKDFLKEYKDDAWKGFSVREVLALISAACIGVGIDAALHLCAGMSIAAGVYIALPLTLPVMLIGFYYYQGFLSARRLLKELSYCMKTTTVLYASNEGEAAEKKAHLFKEDAQQSHRIKHKKRGDKH